MYLAKLTWSRTDQKIEREWHSLNLGTGAIRALEQKQPPSETYEPPEDPFAEALAALPVRIQESRATLTEQGTQQTLRPLWLTGAAGSERPRALVAADSRTGMLLPDASAVIYLQQGALYAVPLVRVDKTAFLAARRAAQKEATLRNAKQLGLGLMMYAQDYDEVFPPAENVTETLAPYLRNEALFNNPATNQPDFVYLLDGNGMASIEAPSETVMGYLRGPGGRAVLYADGRAIWEDDGV